LTYLGQLSSRSNLLVQTHTRYGPIALPELGT